MLLYCDTYRTVYTYRTPLKKRKGEQPLTTFEIPLDCVETYTKFTKKIKNKRTCRFPHLLNTNM